MSGVSDSLPAFRTKFPTGVVYLNWTIVTTFIEDGEVSHNAAGGQGGEFLTPSTCAGIHDDVVSVRQETPLGCGVI